MSNVADSISTHIGTESGFASLAERVKAVRSAWGWSQETMADVLRVDQASVSFWERGKIKPSGSAMVALAALFRCTVEALESGAGFRIPEAPGTGRVLQQGDLPRSVCLPPMTDANIILVDLSSGAAQEQSSTEALQTLSKAREEERRVWVVVE